MEQYQRFSALNSSNIMQDDTLINRIVDFEVPMGDVYDLSKAYISLPMRVTQAAGTCEAYTLSADGATSEEFKPEKFIRHINVKSDRLGVIEDIKEVGLLRQVLNQYTGNTLMISKNESPFGTFDGFSNMNSPFRILRKEGTHTAGATTADEPSELVTCEVHIYLNKLLSLGQQTAFSTGKYGNLRISVELDFRNVVVTQIVSDDTANSIFPTATFMAVANGEGTRGAMVNTNTSGGGETNRQLTTTSTYPDVRFSPFWIGQRLVVEKGGGAGDINPGNRTIIGITHQTNGKLTLTFDSNISTAAGVGALTGVTVKAVNQAGLLQVDAPELVMVKTSETPPDMFEIVSFNTEQDSGASGTSVNRMYSLAPNSIGVLVMGPNATSTQSSLGSLQTYRFRVNNNDVTDRDVRASTSLHHDLIRETLKDLGFKARDYRGEVYDVKNPRQQDRENSFILNEMIACPLPDDGLPKLLDVSITAAAGPNNGINVYSAVVKQF